jgi:hypothetical protein
MKITIATHAAGPMLALVALGCGTTVAEVDGGPLLDARRDESGLALCDSSGHRFIMEGAFAATATDVLLFRDHFGDNDIIGFAGSEPVRGHFKFRRDGSDSAGDLQAVRTYDVSQFPHNIHFVAGSWNACGDAPIEECNGFFALGGRFTVTQLSPTYEATFSFTTLHEGTGTAPGELVAGEIVGCVSVPNAAAGAGRP